MLSTEIEGRNMSPVRPLGPRLENLAALVPSGARVADVGADHGDLANLLLCSRQVEYCVASEKLKSRMKRLDELKARFPEDPRLTVRWGDGLSALRPSDRIDTVVIAGMGSRTIQSILRAPPASVQNLILQPQTETPALRAWLDQNGWCLSKESLCYEGGKGYEILALTRGASPAGLWAHPTLTRADLENVGPFLAREKAAATLQFWRSERDRAERNLTAALTGTTARPGSAVPPALHASLASAQRIVEALEAS